MTNGNGNGNGNGKRAPFSDDGKTTVPVTELVSASVLSLFFVQKLGKAAASDVLERIVAAGGTIDNHLLDQALEALRGRGLCSYARGSKVVSGEKVRMYKTTKVKWASPPEVAHIKDLLPALVETEEARRITNILNGNEEIGDGEKKSKRKLGYAEYWEIRAKFRTLNPMIGSQPDSPWLRKIVKDSKVKAPDECDLRFWRDEVSGAIVIPSDVVLGWVRTGIRYGFSKADTAAQYITAGEVHLMPKEVHQVELPIIVRGEGAGLGTYELLPKGTELSIDFRVPARGIADPKTFVMWLAAYAPRPKRGLSPARGRRFGKMELIDYKISGLSDDVAISLDSVLNTVESDEAKMLLAKLYAEASASKVHYTKSDKGGAKPSDFS